MLSTIDAFGLLDAPENQDKATGKSFKSWVNKYFCKNPGIEYSADDLWAYRCSLLHTYTTQSDLSKAGKAKEILFYAGDKFSTKATEFSDYSNQLSDNGHVAANIEETVLTFAISCQSFARELGSKCTSSANVKQRVNKIISKARW